VAANGSNARDSVHCQTDEKSPLEEDRSAGRVSRFRPHFIRKCREMTEPSKKKPLDSAADNDHAGETKAGGELHQAAGAGHPELTTNQGLVIFDNQNVLKVMRGTPRRTQGHF